MRIKHLNIKQRAFTIVELLVGIAIVAILMTIALPSLNNFTIKMRVDNEISELQKLLLTARSMAINTGKNTTVCPLNGSGNCTTNWQNEISVFTNSDNTLATNNTFLAPDELIRVKEAIKTGDTLQYTQTSVIFTPNGQIITTAAQFNYCPKDNADISRGISVSISGRSFTSSDTNNDGKDENRNGVEISLSCP